MDKQQCIDFLFAITKEIKNSFKTPVILLTMKDYAQNMFNLLLDMREILLSSTAPEPVANIIHIFHVEWLQAVKDIENLKKRLKDTPRESIINAIHYTTECASKRFINFQRFIESSMTSEEKTLIHTELTSIRDMQQNVLCILKDKQTSFKNQADHTEYYIKVYYEIKELLNWLDRLNNDLALEFSKVLRVSHLPTDLTASLNKLISEIADPSSNYGQDNVENHSSQAHVRGNISHNLKIKTVTENIKALDERINQIKNENTSKLLTLQHKKLYLKERLQSLVNLKLSLNALKLQKNKTNVKKTSASEEPYIFNHLLPPLDRCLLVDNLIKLWDNALRGDPDNNFFIPSTFSAKDVNKKLSNDFDNFTVDNYGRKIYCLDNKLYQLNEKSNLVLVNDEQHVYYYDECGRYYKSCKNQHNIYKDHDSASEYFMDSSGLLVKIKDVIDGIEYFYDEQGSYYVNEHGKRIYSHPDTNSEYEKDSFGNLVKVRDEEMPFSTSCPKELIVTNDSNYLKETIGVALKKCIAEVIIHQPLDPITYLADCLEKYRRNVETRQKLHAENRQRMAEIKLQIPERELQNITGLQNTPEPSYYVEEEQSCVVYNFSNYESSDF